MSLHINTPLTRRILFIVSTNIIILADCVLLITFPISDIHINFAFPAMHYCRRLNMIIQTPNKFRTKSSMLQRSVDINIFLHCLTLYFPRPFST